MDRKPLLALDENDCARKRKEFLQATERELEPIRKATLRKELDEA
jgi:hypothetical protein